MFKSGQLADRVERRMGMAVPGLFSRGVKRAGFKVLHSLALPSILCELGYTSNPTDAAFLKHPPSQQRLAQSIFTGVKDFLAYRIQEGVDSNYYQYVTAIEAAKRAKAEKTRAEREKRLRALRNSRPYTVKSGDTISKIGNKFKVSLASLCTLNQFSRKHRVKNGEVIRIPGT